MVLERASLVHALLALLAAGTIPPALWICMKGDWCAASLLSFVQQHDAAWDDAAHPQEALRGARWVLAQALQGNGL